VAYEKQGVLSTQLQGGAEGHAMTPLLVEHVVTLTKHLSSKINQQLKEYKAVNCPQHNRPTSWQFV
jgi:hypothetical protein